MTNCPCCSHQMLRHIRLHEIYWFCRHCWQEMPNLSSEQNKSILALTGTITSVLREQFTNFECSAIASSMLYLEVKKPRSLTRLMNVRCIFKRKADGSPNEKISSQSMKKKNPTRATQYGSVKT